MPTYSFSINEAQLILNQFDKILPKWPACDELLTIDAFDAVSQIRSDYADLYGLLKAALATSGLTHLDENISYVKMLEGAYLRAFASPHVTCFEPSMREAILQQLRQMLSDMAVERLAMQESKFSVNFHEATVRLLGLTSSTINEEDLNEYL